MTISPVNPSPAQLLRSPLLLLAFGFGSGLAPRAPGTVGSLAALLLWPLLLMLPTTQMWLLLALGSVAGIAICGVAAKQLGVHDHGGIVWDEFIGLWLVLALLPATLPAALLGFVLFRVFDIAKPWPISWCDKRIDGGFGIMLDDIIAGLFAALVGQGLLIGLDLYKQTSG
ncbi:MAG: phosphatidylglycerophosphatase A [Porticoccaceae bacterium]